MSLELDQRQRAMLAEMRVPVWWPIPDDRPLSSGKGAVEAPVSASAPAAAAPSVPRPAPAPAHADGGAQTAALLGRAADVGGMDWPALIRAVQDCHSCGLCEGRKAVVFAADLPPVQADWLVVGEPPDEGEEQAGMPFVGPVGQLLDNMLRAVQCRRDGQGLEGARLTNVVKCRPSAVRNPHADELAQCAVYLRREIELTRPRVILAMGRFAALSMLAGEYPEVLQLPFGQLRGRVYRYLGVPVVVTYHPARLLRAPLQKAHAWADLCLARSQLR